MSVQTGLWHFDGAPFDDALLERVTAAASQYGPDGCTRYTNGTLGMTYQAFHTNSLSRREHQPYVFTHGHILTWDGRLDNREDLLAQLNLIPTFEDGNFSTKEASSLTSTSFTSVAKVDRSEVAPTDIQIVAAAFLQWGTDAFVKLIGDWALALWDNRQKRLLLARDFCGIRHLYYSFLPGSLEAASGQHHREALNGNRNHKAFNLELSPNRILSAASRSRLLWSTNLAAIVTQSHAPLTISDAYIAGFLDRGAEPYLTPYNEILAVPPGCWVEVETEARPEKAKASRWRSLRLRSGQAGKTSTSVEMTAKRSTEFSSGPAFGTALRSSGSTKAAPSNPVTGYQPPVTSVHVYWRWNENHEIRYETDAEYEEHFRRLFRQAVRRRLRSDSPILAELSGGLDSSSIVCMADDILQEAVNSQQLKVDSKTDASSSAGAPHVGVTCGDFAPDLGNPSTKEPSSFDGVTSPPSSSLATAERPIEGATAKRPTTEGGAPVLSSVNPASANTSGATCCATTTAAPVLDGECDREALDSTEKLPPSNTEGGAPTVSPLLSPGATCCATTTAVPVTTYQLPVTDSLTARPFAPQGELKSCPDATDSLTPRMDTLSYYNTEEPTGDERPYFTIIEQKRGRTGHHINAAKYSSIDFDLPTFIPIPIYPQGFIEGERDRWELMERQGNRVVLSGLGGDEFLGGVPTPIPELADLVYNLFHPFRKKAVTSDSCLVTGKAGAPSSVCEGGDVSSSSTSKTVGNPLTSVEMTAKRSTELSSSVLAFGTALRGSGQAEAVPFREPSSAPSSVCAIAKRPTAVDRSAVAHDGEGGDVSSSPTSKNVGNPLTSVEMTAKRSKESSSGLAFDTALRGSGSTEAVSHNPSTSQQSPACAEASREGTPLGDPLIFSDVWQTKDFKSNEFGSVASKGVTEPFPGSVAGKEVNSRQLTVDSKDSCWREGNTSTSVEVTAKRSIEGATAERSTEGFSDSVFDTALRPDSPREDRSEQAPRLGSGQAGPAEAGLFPKRDGTPHTPGILHECENKRVTKEGFVSGANTGVAEIGNLKLENGKGDSTPHTPGVLHECENKRVTKEGFVSGANTGVAEIGNGKLEIRNSDREWLSVNKPDSNIPTGVPSRGSAVTDNSSRNAPFEGGGVGSGLLKTDLSRAQSRDNRELKTGAHQSTAVISDQSSVISKENSRNGASSSIAKNSPPELETENCSLMTGVSSPIGSGLLKTENCELKTTLTDHPSLKTDYGLLMTSLGAWSKAKKMPRLKLLYRAVRATLPDWLRSRLDSQPDPYPIVTKEFAKKAKRLRKQAKQYLYGQERLPSRRSRISTWEHLLSQTEQELPPMFGSQERTFPYFDRDLLEFLHAIPRNQLIRIGQRRSLMRRALAGLVPHGVLWRKNKAVSARILMRALEDVIASYHGRVDGVLAIKSGYFDEKYLEQAFEGMRGGRPQFLDSLRKFTILELWLEKLQKTKLEGCQHLMISSQRQSHEFRI